MADVGLVELDSDSCAANRGAKKSEVLLRNLVCMRKMKVNDTVKIAICPVRGILRQQCGNPIERDERPLSGQAAVM